MNTSPQAPNPAKKTLLPLAERQARHQKSQKAYHQKHRQGTGSRASISEAAFMRLEKFGSICHWSEDKRISAATSGLIAFIQNPSFNSVVGGLTAHREPTVERVNNPIYKILEDDFRNIAIAKSNPLNRPFLNALIDYVSDRSLNFPKPQKEKTKEIWLPLEVGVRLREIAKVVETNGAPGFFATRGKTSVGKVIDWLVETEFFARLMNGHNLG